MKDIDLTEAILDSLDEGMFTVDKNFRINSINRAAERMFGIERKMVVNDYCKNIFRSKRCFGECPIERVLETGSTLYDLESEISRNDGTVLPVKLNANVLRDSSGRPIGGVVSFRDMTYLAEMKKNLEKASSFHGIVGQHKSMQDIYTLIEEIAESNSSVMITGESGTGKELVADAVVNESIRKSRPFIKINCSVFPPQLLASELFGHVKGAFTDAVKDRIGRFELADKGTIFLDEVAEMPLRMQVQLLRVLQEGTFERIGESVTRKTDVRVIAATNKDIQKEIESGNLREDLFYRLNVIPIHLPPLRDRRSDITHLVQHFLQKYALTTGKNIAEVDDEAMDLLAGYQWPGNVRELENAIEYAFARTQDTVIHASKLPLSVRLGTRGNGETQTQPGNTHPDEYLQLRDLLQKHQWNRSKVARELGMGRTTLWRKLKAHGLSGE